MLVERPLAQGIAVERHPVAGAKFLVGDQRREIRNAVVSQVQRGEFGELRERREVHDPVRRGEKLPKALCPLQSLQAGNATAGNVQPVLVLELPVALMVVHMA